MILNLRRGTLSWDDGYGEPPVKMSRCCPNGDISFLRAIENTTVKAGTAHTLHACFEGSKSQFFRFQPVVVETDERSYDDNGLVVQEGLCIPQCGYITVRIANPAKHDVLLEMGAIVGQASIALDVHAMPDTEQEFERRYGHIMDKRNYTPVHSESQPQLIKSVEDSSCPHASVMACPAYQRIVKCQSDASEQGGLEDTSVLFPPTEIETVVENGDLPTHVQQLYEDTPIEEGKDAHIIKHLLQEWLVLFQSPDNKLSSDTSAEHEIVLEDEEQKPIKQQVLDSGSLLKRSVGKC